MIFFVDDAFSNFGNSDDFVGEHKTFVFNLVDEGVACVHAGTIKFGGVDVGDEREVVFFFSEDTSFVSEPIVGMDEVGFEIHQVFLDKFTIRVLNVADGDELILFFCRDDFFENLERGVRTTAVAIDRVKMSGRQNVHEFNLGMFGGVGDDKIYIGALTC